MAEKANNRGPELRNLSANTNVVRRGGGTEDDGCSGDGVAEQADRNSG